MYNRSKQNTQDRQLTVPGRLGMTSKFTKKNVFIEYLRFIKVEFLEEKNF